jgi:hypothetical protein
MSNRNLDSPQTILAAWEHTRIVHFSEIAGV